MHQSVIDRPATTGFAASVAEDERHLCFESDPTASFLVAPDGVPRAANREGEAMLADGLLRLDGQRRLCVGDARSRRPIVEDRAARVQVHTISPTQWLVVSLRRLAEHVDTLLVRARAFDVDGALDLAPVANHFGLTDSERPVLEGLAQAVCPKDISRRLGLSIHTIRSHLRSIYAKLGARSAAEAQTIALRLYYVITLNDNRS